MDRRRKRAAAKARRKRIVRRNIFLLCSGIVVCLAGLCFLPGYLQKDREPDAEQTIAQKNVSGNGNQSSSSGESLIAEEVISTSGNDAAGGTEEDSPVTLTISAAGDCTLGTDVNFDESTSFVAKYNEVGDPGYFLANVRDIFSSDDLTIANLEGTLTTGGERADKTFAFRGDPSYTQILTSGSVEAVNLANNHSKDYGLQSYQDTIANVEAAGIVSFGYERTALMEIKGIKVGLVGTYELAEGIGCREGMIDSINSLKAQGAQLIIASFHWGTEKEYYPDEVQKELAHGAIDAGAHLVLGHHPHVLQGIEKYHGRYICYSLGNFCFGGNAYPSDMDTIIFQQTFTIDQNGVKDDNVTNIIPCSISSDSDYNNYQPTPAEGEEATRIMQKIQKRSSWIKDGTVSDSETATESDEEYDENSDAFTDSDDTEDPEA